MRYLSEQSGKSYYLVDNKDDKIRLYIIVTGSGMDVWKYEDDYKTMKHVEYLDRESFYNKYINGSK